MSCSNRIYTLKYPPWAPVPENMVFFMKKLFTPLLALCLCAYTVDLNGQQLPHFSQYQEYQSLINPGSVSQDYIRSNGTYNFSVGLSHRHEGIEGFTSVPITQVLQLEWVETSRRNPGAKLILGGQIMHDQFGPSRQLAYYGRVGVLFPGDTERKEYISGGLTFGGIQFSQSIRGLNFENKEALGIVDFSQTYYNVGLGLFYQIGIGNFDHPIYIGVSMPQLSKINLKENLSEVDRDNFQQEFIQQYFMTIGGYYLLSDLEYWHHRLWVQARDTDGFRINFNTIYQTKQPFWLGAGLGLGLGDWNASKWEEPNSLHLEFGLIVNQPKNTGFQARGAKPYLKIGVGYDYYLGNKLPSPIAHAFELNLKYLMPPSSNR